MTDQKLENLFDKTRIDLLGCREKLVNLISKFSEVDPAFMLVQRIKSETKEGGSVGPDAFAFAAQATSGIRDRQINLVAMPYGELLDNFIFFEKSDLAQTACDALNQSNEGMNLAPRTPSMCFYEQLTEVDRILANITDESQKR